MVPEGCPLTERQYQIASLVGDCRSLGEIADLLDIDLELVRWHVRAACKRLGVSGRWGLAEVMVARGWDVAPDPPLHEETRERLAAARVPSSPALDRLVHLLQLTGVR